MKLNLLIGVLAGGLLASCNPEADSGSADSGNSKGGGGLSEPPAPPTAEVLASLQAQPIGQKLLGNTRILVGDTFVEADLNTAPEYYLVYYSASW